MLNPYRFMGKATILLVAFFSLCAKANTSEPPEKQTGRVPDHKVYYSLGDEHNTPTPNSVDHFDCTDKIFTVAELQNYTFGEHHFSVKWIDPIGNIREHTQYKFRIHREQPNRIWAWLMLSRARGTGMLTWINPAAGLEEFIGEWQIEVRINDKLISDGRFEVSC